MCATSLLLALCVRLLCLNYNINQLQKKIYSDHTSLREPGRLIWKWDVCQAASASHLSGSRVRLRACLLVVTGHYKSNKLWLTDSTWPKTPGQKMIETIRNVKAVHCVREQELTSSLNRLAC